MKEDSNYSPAPPPHLSKNVVPEGSIGPHIVRDTKTGLLLDLSIDPVSGRRRRRKIPLAYDERGWPIWAYNDNGTPVCGAKRKGMRGKICLNTARKRNGRCVDHAGNRPRGIEHHSFRSGRYSQVLDKKVSGDFMSMLQDPEYLSLKQNIALVDTQIIELMRNFEGGLDEYSWEKMLKCKSEAEVLVRTSHHGDKEEMLSKLVSVLSKMCILIDHGSKATGIWSDIAEASTKRAKLVQVETQRLVAERNSIPADTAYTLFAMILQAVKRNVKDKVALASIAREIDQLALNPVNRVVLGGQLDVEAMSSRSALSANVDPTREGEEQQVPSASKPLVDIDHLEGFDEEDDGFEDLDDDEVDE